MIPLGTSLVWILALALFWRELKPLVQRRLTVAEKRVSLEAMRVEVERMAVVRPAIKDDDPMPNDMIQWAMSESFDWAREDKLARMRELYAKFRDWEKVRSALMAEEEIAVKQTF